MVTLIHSTHEVVEDENTCSQAAIIKVLLKSQIEKATVILAEEKHLEKKHQ